jgi:ParB family chromosome partitioning protein
MDAAQNLVHLPLQQIAHTPEDLNSRIRYDEEALAELTESVREHGVLEPVLVRPLQPGEAAFRAAGEDEVFSPKYVIVAGNRRLAAAKRAGSQTIPAIIRVTTRDESFVLNIIENIQRENLSGSERARAIALLASLREESGEAMSTRRIAAMVKKDYTTISKWLGINRQPLLREAVAAGTLKIGHAMKLASVPAEALPELVSEAPGLSQPELEDRIAKIRAAPAVVSQRVAAANHKQAMAALRSLSRIQRAGQIDHATRSVLEQVVTRARDLLAQPGPC